MNDERYLTAQQVADRYHLTLQWVYGCRSLPRRKIGKYLRFLESDLEDWEKMVGGTVRTYGFHAFHPKEVKLRSGRYSQVPSHNSLNRNTGEFVLLFDISEAK